MFRTYWIPIWVICDLIPRVANKPPENVRQGHQESDQDTNPFLRKFESNQGWFVRAKICIVVIDRYAY